jgi:hypothetical protein
MSVTIDAMAAGAGSGTLSDTLLFLYEGEGVPTDPLECVAGDDDSGEGRDARLEGIIIESDRDYFLIVSSFYDELNENAYGTYELVLTAE